MRRTYNIIILNDANIEIDRQQVQGKDGADALKNYIEEFNPIIEDGDSIKIEELTYYDLTNGVN